MGGVRPVPGAQLMQVVSYHYIYQYQSQSQYHCHYHYQYHYHYHYHYQGLSLCRSWQYQGHPMGYAPKGTSGPTWGFP